MSLTQDAANTKMISNTLDQYINEVKQEFDLIEVERKELLIKFAQHIADLKAKGKQVDLTFICTHNSRRSHMSQIWAQVAAFYYGVEGVTCYSGGTEATAFFPAAVKAIEKTGIKVLTLSEGTNPVYAIKYSDNAHPLICFSKKYDDTFNPQESYTAVMTCDNADKNCPYIPEAKTRFPIKYKDPKVSDGTEEQAKTYNERCRQIARELLFAFSKV